MGIEVTTYETYAGAAAAAAGTGDEVFSQRNKNRMSRPELKTQATPPSSSSSLDDERSSSGDFAAECPATGDAAMMGRMGYTSTEALGTNGTTVAGVGKAASNYTCKASFVCGCLVHDPA